MNKINEEIILGIEINFEIGIIPKIGIIINPEINGRITLIKILKKHLTILIIEADILIMLNLMTKYIHLDILIIKITIIINMMTMIVTTPNMMTIIVTTPNMMTIIVTTSNMMTITVTTSNMMTITVTTPNMMTITKMITKITMKIPTMMLQFMMIMTTTDYMKRTILHITPI